MVANQKKTKKNKAKKPLRKGAFGISQLPQQHFRAEDLNKVHLHFVGDFTTQKKKNKRGHLNIKTFCLFVQVKLVVFWKHNTLSCDNGKAGKWWIDIVANDMPIYLNDKDANMRKQPMIPRLTSEWFPKVHIKYQWFHNTYYHKHLYQFTNLVLCFNHSSGYQ